MDNNINVSLKFLDNLLKFQGRKLTGIILRRIEEGKSQDEIKRCLKNIIPEWCRELKYHMQSYKCGAEEFYFEFKRPKKKDNAPKE